MASNPFFLSSTCSGHGRVEFTPNGSELLFATYCICDDGYSGLADYFDLRVIVKNGTNPSFEAALDCSVSSIGVNVAYAITFFAYFTRIWINLAALYKKVGSYIERGGSKKFGHAWMFMPIRALTVDTTVTCWHLYMCIGKFIDPATAVLGTSVSVTIAHVVPILGLNVAMMDYEMATVLSLANIHTWDRLWSTPFTRFYALSCASVIVGYALVVVISLIATGLDKSNGPIESGELTLLIVRNITVALYWVMYFVMFTHVVSLAKKVRETLSRVQEGENTPRVSKLIAYLEQINSNIRKRLVIAVTAYLIMLIPWTYGYQYIGIAVIDALSGFTGMGTQFLRGSAMMAEPSASKHASSAVADGAGKQQQRQEPQPIPSAGPKASSGTAVIAPAESQ